MNRCTKPRLHKQSLTSLRQKGFTLIELVIVIVILGIVSISISGIIRSAMEVVITVSERESLVREGSYLVERFNRELASSVPNSVRISGNASAHCVEFVPLKWNGIYLSLPLAGQVSNTADLVELSDIQNRAYTPTTTDFAIVYPTRPSEVYDASIGHRRPVISCTDDDSDCSTLGDADKVIQLEVSDGFAQTSPSNRIYFVEDTVSYCMRNNQVYRHVGSIAQTQTLHTSGGSLMAQNLVNTLGASASSGEQNPFKSIGANAQRNASTQALFMFGRDEERVTFMQEVQIPNVP